jgi:NADPH:quinone reductase-like Zn-dependent oxidoreductase
MTSLMRAAVVDAATQAVRIAADAAVPAVGPDSVLVRVHAAGVNRLDLLQRAGKYPPPPGDSDTLGVEVAGTVAAVGPVSSPSPSPWTVGDRVMALVGGGGYADYCVAPAANLMPVPASMSMTDAAAIPEAFLTAYGALVQSAAMRVGETVLVHAAASGVGLAAIQLARALGAGAVIAVAGSDEKLAVCRSAGATHTINYKAPDAAPFDEQTSAATGGRGANVILDFVGGPNLQRNLSAAAMEGRIVLLGMYDASAHTYHRLLTPQLAQGRSAGRRRRQASTWPRCCASGSS